MKFDQENLLDGNITIGRNHQFASVEGDLVVEYGVAEAVLPAGSHKTQPGNPNCVVLGAQLVSQPTVEQLNMLRDQIKAIR